MKNVGIDLEKCWYSSREKSFVYITAYTFQRDPAFFGANMNNCLKSRLLTGVCLMICDLFSLSLLHTVSGKKLTVFPE